MSFLQTKYLIIGAGLAGLTVAYHLKKNYILVESNATPGGTASTFKIKGFKLDNAVHILYFRQSETKDWVENALGVPLLEKIRESSVWINNSYVRFPLQYHLCDLSLSSRLKSFQSLIKSLTYSRTDDSNDFKDYSLTNFGKHITDILIRPYNEKMFGVSLEQLSTKWLGDYVQEYSKKKMLLSALGFVNKNYGRNFKFYYPSKGGISTLSENISSKLNISPKYGCRLLKIILNKKVAIFNDGTEVKYRFLINTIPLKNLLMKIEYLPTEIFRTAGLLSNNSTTILHLLLKGVLNVNEEHWIYIPEPSIPFYRLTIPGNINTLNCPQGYFALTLEFGGNVCNNQDVLNSSIKALREMKLLKQNDNEIEYYWRLLDCGYVIYDNNRKTAIVKIFPFLLVNQIFSIGRYGSWEYSNMEDAINQGKKIAKELLSEK